MSTLRIMVHSLETAKAIYPPATHHGDIRLHWSAGDPEDVATAREAFRRARSRGFRAFRTARGEGDEIREFDASAEEIWMLGPVVGGSHDEIIDLGLDDLALAFGFFVLLVVVGMIVTVLGHWTGRW